MSGLFDSYIYGEDKRKAMRQTPQFKAVRKLIEKEDIITTQQTGDCAFLLRKQFEKNKEIITWLQWEDMYLSSGKHRNELLRKAGSRPTYQLMEYYGRTEEDIFNISKETYPAIKSRANMTPQAWLNIIYIMIMDESYENHRRVMDAYKSLMATYGKKYEFEITDAITMKEQYIDFFLYSADDGNLEGGIKILPDENKGIFLDPEYEKIRKEMEQKHELFKQAYDTDPHFVFVREGGALTTKLNI